MKFLLISLVVLGCGFLFPAPLVDSAHILAVYPSFIRSHLTVAEGILEQLAENGHQVSALSIIELLLFFTQAMALCVRLLVHSPR